MSHTFFSDRDLGKHDFPGILLAAGISIERHVDHFAHDTPDEEWLRVVCARGWVALTMDSRMIRRAAVQDIVMASGARLLRLSGANAPAGLIARNFVNTLPRIERFLSARGAPLIARVTRPTGGANAVAAGKPGNIILHLDTATWRARRQRSAGP